MNREYRHKISFLGTSKYYLFSSPEDNFENEIVDFSCSKNANLYCVLMEKNSLYHLIVFIDGIGYKDWNIYFPVSDIHWINLNICLILEDSFILFNPLNSSYTINNLPLFHIYKIIYINSKIFIYSTFSEMNSECSVRMYNFYTKKDFLICKISSYGLTSDIQFLSLTDEQIKAIKKFIAFLPTYGKCHYVGLINNQKIVLEYKRLNTQILVNGITKWTVPGFIHAADIFKNCLVVLWSHLIKEPELRLLNINSKVYDFPKNSLVIAYRVDSETSQFFYFIEARRSSVTFLFLHGGPTGQFINQYSSIYAHLHKKNFNVLLLNYMGSSGYTSNYQKALVGNGGRLDIELIKKFIKNYLRNNKSKQIIVVGESYGGYLSVLLAKKFKNEHHISFISISGFVDVRYQYLFSPARNVVQSYLLNDYENNKFNIDPAQMEYKDISNLSFIHGENDAYCSINQIKNFCRKNNFKLSIIKDLNHVLMTSNNKKSITHLLLKEINYNE